MSGVAFKDAALARGFTQIPNDVLVDTRLSVQARMTWMLLAKYAWQGSKAFPSQETLGSLLGVGERSVRAYIAELTKTGWVETRRRGLGKTNEYLLVVPEVGLQPRPEAENLSDRSPTSDKEDSVEEDSVSKDSPSKTPSQKTSGEVRQVFEHWQQVMGKPRSLLTEERRQKIKARLEQGYSVDRCKAAIDGCATSDFHMGRENGKGEQNHLELIFRNGSHLERFADMLDKPEPVRRDGWTGEPISEDRKQAMDRYMERHGQA